MTETHVTLYGEDSEEFDKFVDRAERELPGDIPSNVSAVKTALDLANEALDKRRG